MRILQAVQAKNQQTEGWLFCHSKFDLPVLAQGHKGPC